MESIDYSNFFLMLSGDKKGAVQFNPVSQEIDAPSLFRNEMKDQKPIPFKIARGKKYYDLIGTGFAYLKIASSSFWRLVKENNFRGIQPIDISVQHVDKLEYSLCSITSNCGTKINELSVQVDRPMPMDPTKTYKTWTGLYFDLKLWDGSDFFSLENTFYTIVTKKVVDVLTENNITNVAFIPVSEVENHDLQLGLKTL